MKLSVIVPVYNVKRYLNRCLDSVVAATDVVSTRCHTEIICIDDGSTDGSSEILHEYANYGSRIKLISQNNQGLAAARNVGLDVVSGNWISFVDSDDWVDESYFVALLDAAERDDAQIASVCAKTCSPEEYWCSSNGIPATAWGKVYRSELWNDVRFPNGRLHEDEFTVHKVVFKCDRIAGIEKPLYRYTRRSDSIMHNVDERNLSDWLEGCDIQAKYLKPISNRAYAVALAKKIQVEHWLGNVQEEDVAEYAKAMHCRIGRYFWPEHYRHPILINRLTWYVLMTMRSMFGR